MTLEPQILAFLAALKVKLMVRRPMTALVEQGILPSTRTSPALHLQRRKLERAKMGDMLRAKIARRPDRQELVHRHILEDVPPRVDRSLCDKQRQLKRAKLADTLSNQLSLRPGPLELIQKNILHTDEPVEQAVKEGQIRFKPTAEGLPTVKVKGVPSSTVTAGSFEEDSSDGAAQSPPDLFQQVSSEGVSAALSSPSASTAVPSPLPLSIQQSSSAPSSTVISGGVAKSESSDSVFSTSNASESGDASSSAAFASPPASVAPPHGATVIGSPAPEASVGGSRRASSSAGGDAGTIFAVPSPLGGSGSAGGAAASGAPMQQAYSQRSAPGKEQGRKKKSKASKAQAKPRTIKFHEYKVDP